MQTTPPFSASERSISSLTFLGISQSALMQEWDTRTGLRVVPITSKKVLSDTCEQSMIMPRRSISTITSRPKSFNPPHIVVSSDESAHSFVFIQVRVMHLTPSLW